MTERDATPFRSSRRQYSGGRPFVFSLPGSNDSDELRYVLDGRVEYQPLFGKGVHASRLGEARSLDSRKRR